MNELEKLFNKKLTENGDVAYKSTGNKLLDILFMTPFFEKNLQYVNIDKGEKEQLFSMFIRDPRFGLGRRDLGRELMKQTDVSPANIVLAGRYDDLIYNPTDENLSYFLKEIKSGNELAKKWAPRRNTANDQLAKALAKYYDLTEKEYRKLVKANTVERTLTEHREEEIDFAKVPSLAMIKYYDTFKKKQTERFEAYRAAVKAGKAKLNVTTANVHDIAKNRDKIDGQMFFDQLEKIKGSWIPVLDTSGSMGSFQHPESIAMKAASVAHYLSKCSSYCPNQVVTFSSQPFLIDMGKARPGTRGYGFWGMRDGFRPDPNKSQYDNEIASLYTGDCSNTDFGKVMELLAGLETELPDYLIVLSDMEFDQGSSKSKDATMRLFKEEIKA